MLSRTIKNIRTPKRVYYWYPYQSECQASVIAINSEDNSVELDKTIFHPQGGGQPSDRGCINGIEVVKLLENKESGAIRHVLARSLSPGDKIEVGSLVNLEIDLEFRTLCAKLHSAGHLIANVAEKAFPGLHAVSGHHFPGEARVVFDGNDLPEKELFTSTVQEGLNSAIESAVPMTYMFKAEEGRKVQIGDSEPTPCGGTHVRDMAEIGKVEITGVKAKKGQLRVSYSV